MLGTTGNGHDGVYALRRHPAAEPLLPPITDASVSWNGRRYPKTPRLPWWHTWITF